MARKLHRHGGLLSALSFKCLLALTCCITGAAAAADEANVFSEFTREDGALTVFAGGDYIEPYAAIKALVVAHRLGVDVRHPALQFSHWILPFQQANGPFPRICRSGGNRWLACGPSDADDSLAVFWCALSSEILPDRRDLDASCDRALDNVASLWDPQRETFRAVFGQPPAYFADNVEMIAFLQSLRTDKAFFRRHIEVLAKLPSLEIMTAALYRNYGYHPDVRLEPDAASLPSTPYGFYPYGVAPLYPMIYNLRVGAAREHDWRAWRKKYGKRWLQGEVDHFPWGLAAVAAFKAGDRRSALTWLHNAVQWRQEGRWNIMEEGAWLGLNKALAAPTAAQSIQAD